MKPVLSVSAVTLDMGHFSGSHHRSYGRLDGLQHS